MINVLRKYPIAIFEYIYMVVMIIYAAQMTPDTGRMLGGLSGNLIPFLIPIILTIILLDRNRVRLHWERLKMIIVVLLLWSVAIIVKMKLYSTDEWSYYFFLFYAIIIAFIHVSVFGKRLFVLYEDIMVKMSYLPLILWVLSLIMPGIMANFFHLFPKTIWGNNFFYLFNWMDPTTTQANRNAGFSWEPGRYAIMLTLAICFNLYRRGVTFRKNRELIVLLLALASTQSTTGYATVIALFPFFMITRFNAKTIIGLIIACFISFYLMKLDFMLDKIQIQLNVKQREKELSETIQYTAATRENGEYVASLERFQAIYYEWKNIKEDPILGYGLNACHSYFSEKISSNFVLTGGILRIFGQYGIPLGLFLYILAFMSSVCISKKMPHHSNLAFFVWLLFSSVSYVIFTIPVFTAFWLYGLFYTPRINDIYENIYRYRRTLP